MVVGENANNVGVIVQGHYGFQELHIYPKGVFDIKFHHIDEKVDNEVLPLTIADDRIADGVGGENLLDVSLLFLALGRLGRDGPDDILGRVRDDAYEQDGFKEICRVEVALGEDCGEITRVLAARNTSS